MAERLYYLVWLTRQAAEGPIYAWPVTLAVALGLAAGLWWSPLRVGKVWLTLRLFAGPFAITVATLLLGTLARTDSPMSAPSWPYYLLTGLLMFHIPLALYLRVKIRSYGWSIVAMTACHVYFSFWAWFVAVMSVTGRWL